MKKSDFVTLIMSVAGGLFFAIGMCMGLVEEWDALIPGVVVGTIGVCVLIAMLIVRRRMQGKPSLRITPRGVGIAALLIAGLLVLGLGLCMVLVWEKMMVWGMIVGVIGILMLLGLIPIWKGLK